MQSKWLGKTICGVFGYLFARLLGLCIGIWIGHRFDEGIWHFETKPSSSVQRVFFEATFLVMGYIAKADGVVSKQGINCAEDTMHQLVLDDNQRLQAIELFMRGKQSDFNLESVLSGLKRACSRYPALLTSFLEIQIQTAYADRNDINVKVKHILSYITQYLDLGFLNFNRQSRQGAFDDKARKDTSLQAAYALLGISGEASPSEIKKAYRKKMSQYHPDKLIAKGVPQEMIKMATEKTQQIKQAYEHIRTKWT